MSLVPASCMTSHDKAFYLLSAWRGCWQLRRAVRSSQQGSWHVNSLAPGKLAWNFRQVIFKQILVFNGWGIPCEIALIWKSLDFTDDQSTLVQVMAWCHPAASHNLSQCWHGFLLPYCVTLPQWVNISASSQWLTARCIRIQLAAPSTFPDEQY